RRTSIRSASGPRRRSGTRNAFPNKANRRGWRPCTSPFQKSAVPVRTRYGVSREDELRLLSILGERDFNVNARRRNRTDAIMKYAKGVSHRLFRDSVLRGAFDGRGLFSVDRSSHVRFQDCFDRAPRGGISIARGLDPLLQPFRAAQILR